MGPDPQYRLRLTSNEYARYHLHLPALPLPSGLRLPLPEAALSCEQPGL